jgi:hypothetical protein
MSGNCENNSICQPAENGATCSEDSGCASGNCTNNVCLANNGDTCTDNSNCISGYCDSGICQPAKDGATCSENNNCKSENCIDGICTEAGCTCGATDGICISPC